MDFCRYIFIIPLCNKLQNSKMHSILVKAVFFKGTWLQETLSETIHIQYSTTTQSTFDSWLMIMMMEHFSVKIRTLPRLSFPSIFFASFISLASHSLRLVSWSSCLLYNMLNTQIRIVIAEARKQISTFAYFCLISRAGLPFAFLYLRSSPSTSLV